MFITKNSAAKKALAAAFPNTIPILTGFAFLGLAYGIYMNASGFSFVYPMLMSLLIFGGSLEFICVSLMLSTFSPLSALLVAVLVQARHLFYGISMLDKYRGSGKLKPYLIFGLIDESFSINYSVKIPEDVDKHWFYFWVTLLNHIFWITSATLGGLIGNLLPSNIKGIDFVMTAMFVTFFVDQIIREKQQLSAIIGVVATFIALILFKQDYFLIPAMITIVVLLALLRKPITKMGGYEE